MPAYRALRGVCIGVDRHLAVGDEADLDGSTAQFLQSIGAVEPVPVEPAKPQAAAPAAPETPPPAKPGKKEN
mgnify:CR=1 FL=1